MASFLCAPCRPSTLSRPISRLMSTSSALSSLRCTLPVATTRRTLSVRAAEEEAKAEPQSAAAGAGASPGPLQTPPDFGLGGKGAWFGFGTLQELNVGRLAMLGFAAALVMEVVTGKGVLGQLGLDPFTVRYPFLLGFAFLLVGGLLGGYVVVTNPPDFSKVPPNLGEGVPRNPFDKSELDRLPSYTKEKDGKPFASDLPRKQ